MSEGVTDPGHESAKYPPFVLREGDVVRFLDAEAFEDPIMRVYSTDEVRESLGIPVLVRLPHESLLAVLGRIWSGNRLVRWWRDYPGNLLVRCAFSEDEPMWRQYLLTLEVVGYIAVCAVFWTAWVLAGLALTGIVLQGLGF